MASLAPLEHVQGQIMAAVIASQPFQPPRCRQKEHLKFMAYGIRYGSQLCCPGHSGGRPHTIAQFDEDTSACVESMCV